MKSLEEIQKRFPNVIITDEYKRVFKYLEDPNAIINVIGPAGTGKSVLLKLLTFACPNLAVCATTGVASALLNEDADVKATTVHSLFGLRPLNIFPNQVKPPRKEIENMIKKLDYLVIDEVSMMNASMLDYVLRLLAWCRSFRNEKWPRIVLFGDVLQLPPVIDLDNDFVRDYFKEKYKDQYFYFHAHLLKGMKVVELKRNFRQQNDENFKEILTRMRVGTTTEEDLEKINQRVMDIRDWDAQHPSSIRLVSTNKEVDVYNASGLRELPGNYIKASAKFSDGFKDTDEYINSPDTYPDYTVLKIGCPVMITRNAPGQYKAYVNGDMGILKKIDVINDEELGEILAANVELNDGRLVTVTSADTSIYEYKATDQGIDAEEVGRYTFLPLRVCFASTVWKVQGTTLDKCFVDLNWCPESVVYVALSRCRHLEDFALYRPLELKDIRVNKEAMDWLLFKH